MALVEQSADELWKVLAELLQAFFGQLPVDVIKALHHLQEHVVTIRSREGQWGS